MQQADVVRRFLLPPHENPAVAVQPGVNALDNPAARAISAAALRLFFAARADVWRIASPAGRAANGSGVVPFVAAEMLLAPASRSWASNGDTIERRLDESLIMHIGASNRHADRHAASVGEHRPFHPKFAAIGRVFPGFFPRPVAPWSAPRRGSAIPRRYHAGRRSVSTATSRADGRHPTPSTLGNSDGWCCRSRTPWARPSIGNQCEAHNRCRSSPPADSPAAVRHAASAGIWAIAAECAARTRPTSANYSRGTPFSRENPPCQARIAPHGVFYVCRRSAVLG
jgi:hypothetical protein